MEPSNRWWDVAKLSEECGGTTIRPLGKFPNAKTAYALAVKAANVWGILEDGDYSLELRQAVLDIAAGIICESLDEAEVVPTDDEAQYCVWTVLQVLVNRYWSKSVAGE